MHFIKPVAMATFVLSAAFAGISAHADTVPLKYGLNAGTETFDDSTGYVDQLTFTLSAASSVNAYFDLGVSGMFYDLDTIDVKLFKVGVPDALLVDSGNVTTYSYLKNLMAGSYYFSISGLPTGLAGGQYNYSINITAIPVPEANTAAMMLLGLSVLGLRARKSV